MLLHKRIECLFLVLTSLYTGVFSSVITGDENCESIEGLGTNDVDRFDFQSNFDVDAEECQFTLDFSFIHDDTLPLPQNGDQCMPTYTGLASDGLPYSAFRWHYESVSEHIKKLTGVDHISLDYNSCGHPPLGVFTVPHYDLHIYRVSPKFRTCMTS